MGLAAILVVAATVGTFAEVPAIVVTHADLYSAERFKADSDNQFTLEY